VRAREALAGATARLRAAGVPDPARDARRLLEHAAGRLWPDDPLADAAGFDALVAQRESRRPLSQIVGRRAFWRHEFQVTADVLDPRPETEAVVAAALERRFGMVADLGTGSGCILVSLLAERDAAQGLGVDASPAALEVAARNAGALGVAARAAWRRGDWLTGVGETFDLIVSNPPYVAPGERPSLAPELAWEPAAALVPRDDPGDGLADCRRIAAQAPARLRPGGRLILEVGAGQAPAVADLLSDAGLDGIAMRPDLDGRDRVVIGEKPA
jgi:release factor glutamine methyltransferase